ncbi:geraniol dehydrogenase 1-like [Solanum verrucosum]|uniref:geraniol dehydrogenase 1-like n=1 Tax=Solanum verrucosum TaxID=315347 RepID=UPI0020D0E901|nr:geraniol dehydrogenase 1-like [Solanum verrucosum]
MECHVVPFFPFGCNVTVISTSINKKDEAIKHLGANSFLISHDQEQMQGATSTLDGIIDTVSAEHPIAPLLNILKPHGKLVMVGLPPKPLELPAWPLPMGNRNNSNLLVNFMSFKHLNYGLF